MQQQQDLEQGAAREALAEALLSGKAWEDFCDRLKAAGRFVQAVDSIDRERDIAEGYRYLTRLARMGLGMILENSTPAAPSDSWSRRIRLSRSASSPGS